MEQISYRVGDLRRMIKESANEFKPKIGDGVEAENKRNNDKSYKDAEKAAKDYDGGLGKENKGNLPDKTDGNRTTLDYNPRIEPSKDFKDKVKAQAQGYTSQLEKDNGIAKAAEFDNDGKIFNQFKDAADDYKKAKEELAHSGLQAHNLKKTEKNTMYENSKPAAKRLNFKHIKFINEEKMLSLVPEEYKRDGQVLYMKDCADNEYVLECSKSEKTGYIETNVVSYKNDRIMNEQVDRINALFDYKTPHVSTSVSNRERIIENNNFGEMMNLSRSLMQD